MKLFRWRTLLEHSSLLILSCFTLQRFFSILNMHQQERAALSATSQPDSESFSVKSSRTRAEEKDVLETQEEEAM